MTLTVGPGCTIDGTTGSVVNASSVGGTTLLNQGTIAADTTTTNSGITLSPNTLTNALTGILQVSNSTNALNINAPTWSNAGTITVSAGTLNLGGTFANSALGTWNHSGGTVNLTGTVTGGLTLDNTRGTWNFAGGTIQGGTFSIAPGSSASLTLTQTSSLTNDVTLLSPIDLTSVGGTLYAYGGLTLDTTMAVGSPTNGSESAQLIFQDTGTRTLRTDNGGTLVMGTSGSD
jgi:hypothetical protein